MGVFQVLATALRAIISMMEIVLVIRVLYELKAVSRDSMPFKFLLLISEPLLYPVRKLLSKQSKEKNLKFDISPLVVMILLYLISMVIKKAVS